MLWTTLVSFNQVLLVFWGRLLEELVQKEKEYQQVLRQNLQQRAQDLELFRLKNRPAATMSALYCVITRS